MKGHKFPSSTTGKYMPGVGYTLTRGNVAPIVKAMRKAEQEVTASTVMPQLIFTPSLVQPRHWARLGKLLNTV